MTVIDRIYQFFEYKFLPSEQPDELNLPKWVNVSIESFNEILSIVTKAKNFGLKTTVERREITLDNTEILPKGITNGKINGSEFKREYNDTVDDMEAILQRQPLTRNHEKMINILSLLKKISKHKDKKTDEQSDPADVSELESQKSAEQSKSKEDKDQKY